MGTQISKPVPGTVVGVSSKSLTYTYIVLLDLPIQDKELGTVRAVTVKGTEMRGRDGEDWKFRKNPRLSM